MKIFSTYSVKIRHYNHIFEKTAELYQAAVDFYISVCLQEWEHIVAIKGAKAQQMFVESLTHRTENRPAVKFESKLSNDVLTQFHKQACEMQERGKYDFSQGFYKFPSYLRRAVISEALGKVSSYKSNLANWEANHTGKKPKLTRSGRVYPAMFRDNMYVRLDDYTAKIKIYIRNTWDWLTVSLRKSDVDYIMQKCSTRKECVPTLQKRGKEWFLDFAFEEKVELSAKAVGEQTVLAVDLGLNNACVCSAMKPDGTILGRDFLSLPREKDCLGHAVNRIKKAQQHGARKTPRLWARAKGINHQIMVKTAQFIIDTARKYHVDVIVFEHLDIAGKKKGSKKQKLHLWRCRKVQSVVSDKAHRLGMRVSRVCAWGTSSLAYDGSGRVERDKDNYSMCRFENGKRYHCDLSATYNIGARYFIREILKSLPVTVRLEAEAKVPPLSKRSTCTYATLISLNAVLAA